MKIGLYHGYNLTGSGSNEFTRYLAKTFINQGHSVHIICREYQPEKIEFIDQLWAWKSDGSCTISDIGTSTTKSCVLHQIPYGDFYPVYITGKKSSTVYREFVDLTDSELREFKSLNQFLLKKIFEKIDIDILHCNHLVMQPSMAVEPCKEHEIPFIIYPHGSAIEYAVKKDRRYVEEARIAIEACQGLIIGNREVRDRICSLFPDLSEYILRKTQIVGVGVDTNLFTPLPRDERRSSISEFIAGLSTGNGQGKSPDSLQKLHHALKRGDYQQISLNSDSYIQNNLDTDIREKLSTLDMSKPLLIFVGALTVGKGLQSLVTAFPQVLKRHPGAQLLVIGAGDFRESLEACIYGLANRDIALLQHLYYYEDGSVNKLWQDVCYFLDQLENADEYFESARALSAHIKFLGRFNHQQLSYVFPCADLAVFPSVIPEAYPLVLMESLANGVLPLVSYFSGFKDGVDELENFLDQELVSHLKIPLDKENRIARLSDNICYLLDEIRSRDFSQKLSSIARNNYDWTHRASQMVEAYQEIV